ncbi:MAG: S8 family serine peptidase [Cyclobacteriaceae bacterium]|nr:S8 family serine peptidase [Cyclobacteriaceae bacterium]
MARINIAIATLLVLLTMPAFGNVNRYMVFFKDKKENPYTLAKPLEFLSARALERRQKQQIAIGAGDLPVSEHYLGQLRAIDSVQVSFASRWFNAVLVEMDEGKLEEVGSLPFVNTIKFVAPGSKLQPDAGNGRKSGQLDIANTEEEEESKAQNEFIGVEEMHEQGYRGEGMLIGVFDSGFDEVDRSPYFSHLFENKKIKGARDFVHGSSEVFRYDSHGSKVLSCISAWLPGEYSGTAPQADVLLCVTEDVQSEFRIEEYNWLFAAEYADSAGVDIINSSVGYSYFDYESMDYSYADMDGNTAVITRAADMAAAKGILVVASVGNEGKNTWKYLNAPSDGDSVLAIGAATFAQDKSAFSSFGPSSDHRIKPDIAALGTWVQVVHNSELSTANGTSFSSPMVAGLAAGLWQSFPHLSNMELMGYLVTTASQADAPDTLLGYGIPDFIRAYNKIKVSEGDVVNSFVVFPNPVTNRRVISFYVEGIASPQSADLQFFDSKGSLIKTAIFESKNTDDPVEIDVSFLKPGAYILALHIDGKARKSKLIVQ